MANLRALLNRLKEEYPNPTTRGRPFENICTWWLKNDPIYADTFKGVWLWYDWPDRERNGFKDETGIDLVGETHTGNLWAIQIKCYIDTQVPLNEIQGFLSLSGREEFGVRLLISVGDLAENAKVHVKKQDKPVQTLFYSDLNNSSVNWLDSLSSKTSKTSNYKSNPEPIDDHYSAEEYLERGKTYYDLEEYEKALDSWSKSIQLDPYNAEAYFLRGQQLWALIGGDGPQEAIDDFTKAIELDLKYRNAYWQRARLYEERGELETAINDYWKITQLYPNDTYAYIEMSALNRRLGDFETAIMGYTKAIEITPNHSTCYIARAKCYKKLGKDDKALADHAKVKEIWDNNQCNHIVYDIDKDEKDHEKWEIFGNQLEEKAQCYLCGDLSDLR